MADERDFELLDDYLTHRMSEPDRLAFERRLEADPDLQHEYALQKRLIKGIKDARVAELKAMLNQVPVPAAQTGNGLGTKVLLGTVISLMIATAGYFYFLGEEPKADAPAVISEQPAAAEKPASKEPEVQKATPSQNRQTPVVQEKRAIEADKNQTSAGTEHSRPSLAKRPDPLQAPEGPAAGKHAAADVTTHEGDNRYSFHYQLKDGKVSLYGPFAENTYEVVRIPQNDERELVALFYEDTFYLLSDSGASVKPLTPLTDLQLIDQLNEFREVE